MSSTGTLQASFLPLYDRASDFLWKQQRFMIAVIFHRVLRSVGGRAPNLPLNYLFQLERVNIFWCVRRERMIDIAGLA